MIFRKEHEMKKIKENGHVSYNIVRIIRQRGYKQCAIAARAGYSKQVFSNMVNDYRVIRPDDIVRIADALDCKVVDLFEVPRRGA